MQPFKAIDDFILDMPLGVQRIANFIEHTTGLKYYIQARIVVMLASAWVVNIFWAEFLAMIDRGEPASSMLFAILWNLVIILLIFSMTKRARVNTDRGHRNPLRDPELEVFFRLLHIFMCVSSGIRAFFGPGSGEEAPFLDHITFFGLTLALYLAACDEAPPQRQTANA